MISAPIPGANSRAKASSMPPVPRLAEHPAAPPGGEHPFVQPFAGVAERCVEALTFAGGETVERDRDVLDSGE
jgi:hypothetical protein